MKKELINLAECLAQDQKFVEEFSKKKTVDEQYAFAQTKVKGYSKDEFVEFMKNLEEAYKLRNELSPEDLEAASGGSGGMAKLAALAMLGLTFTGGAMNMATSLPTFADTTQKENELNAFRKKIMLETNGDEFEYNACSKNGSTREALKKTIQSVNGSKNIIREMCDSRKIVFNRRRPDGMLGYTYWSMDFNSELPDWIQEVIKYNQDKENSRVAKEILLWLSGKELYFKDDNTFQIYSNGAWKNVDYNLFEYETGEIYAEQTFSTVLYHVRRCLNRDRALRGALEELGDTDLAELVMKDVASFETSGAKNLETLIQNVNFNYTNSSINGTWRNTISHMLQNEEIRENVMDSIARDSANSPLEFYRHRGWSTSWSFKIKPGREKDIDDIDYIDGMDKGIDASKGMKRVLLKYLQGKLLSFDKYGKLSSINLEDFEKFLESSGLESSDNDAYKEGRVLVDEGNFTKGSRAARGNKMMIDRVANIVVSKLNQARAMRGALEDASGKVKDQRVKNQMEDLQKAVMPDAK